MKDKYVRKKLFILFGFIVLLAFTMLTLSGCVAPEDKARLIILEEKILEYEKLADDIYVKVQAGTITMSEARTLYADIKNDTGLITNEINILKAKGYSGLEIVLAVLERLGIIAASLGATRIWRGGVHNRKGET